MLIFGCEMPRKPYKDLKKSTLIPPRAPIIFIELQLSAEGAGYVTQLEDIRNVFKVTHFYVTKIISCDTNDTNHVTIG